MDCRHPDSQDTSGDIHVNLDSSTPCWKNGNRGVLLELTEAPPPRIFKGDAEFTEIGVFLDQELFPLRPQRLPAEFSSGSIQSE